MAAVVEEWCLDDELLARMEAREDANLGRDAYNYDTFGDAVEPWKPDHDQDGWRSEFREASEEEYDDEEYDEEEYDEEDMEEEDDEESPPGTPALDDSDSE